MGVRILHSWIVVNAVRLKHGDACHFDDAVHDVLAIAMDDIFGEPADEKEVRGIVVISLDPL